MFINTLFYFLLLNIIRLYSCRYFSLNINKKVHHKKMHDISFLGTHNSHGLELDHVLKSQANVNTYQSLLKLPDNYFITNQTAALSLNNFQNVQYYGSLFIGSQRQKVSVIFDSGSNILWLPSSDCPTCRAFSRKFDYTVSSSFSTLNKQKNITV